MNNTTVFEPAAAADREGYDARNLTEEEVGRLQASGHRLWTTIPQAPVSDLLKRLGLDS